MAKPEYALPDGDADRRAYADVAALSFGANPADFRTWISDQPPEAVRLLRQGKRIIGGLVIYRAGQFFGGRSVPTWGIAGVAVSPELRSQGHANFLMKECLTEAAREGVALSTLYPATQRPYRNLGWEVAGRRVKLGVPCKSLPVHETSGLEEVDARDSRLVELYRQWAASRPGCMDRNDPLWERVRRAPKDMPLTTWLVTVNHKPAGFMMYLPQREPGVLNYDIIVRDFVWLNATARDRLIGLLAAQRTVANKVVLPVSDDDPALASLTGGHTLKAEEHMSWMLRVVDVKAALLARGWPSSVDMDLNFRVKDSDIPANNKAWGLQLRDGNARVVKGKGGPDLDIRGLAALFSSRTSPAQLRTMGLMEGAEDHDGALQAAFAGPSPWMPDFF